MESSTNEVIKLKHSVTLGDTNTISIMKHLFLPINVWHNKMQKY